MTYGELSVDFVKFCPFLFSPLDFLTMGEGESIQLAFPKLSVLSHMLNV